VAANPTTGPQQTYLGIEIGGTKLQLVLGDEAGRIIERRRYHIDRIQGGAGIRAFIESALRDLVPEARLHAAAVGFGGPVDPKTGRICCSHQIEGWAGFDLGSWLNQLAGVPIYIENDANTAALAEALHGAGAGSNPVFYVTLGSGVGGGLVVDGAIYHGAIPGEVEIGHLRLDRSGTTVEARCSGWAVDAKIRALLADRKSSVLCDWINSPPGSEAKHLARALERGDAEAQRILRETASDLAFGLSHVTHLFHPQVIVIGGGLSLVGEPLRAAVAECLSGLIMDAFAPGPQTRLASLGEDAVPVGCLLAAHRVATGRLKASAG